MIPVNDLKRGYLLHKDEYNARALEVLESGWYVLGKQVECFEKEFAKQIGAKFCVGVDNGLNAICLGIKALGIGEGDEVIVQANTYIATCLGVSSNSAKVVLVEPDDYYNMDPQKVEAAITDKTKAVLVTHLYGQATDMKAIVEACFKRGIYLLEDCAQSHFAKYNNQTTGTIGVLGFFSFYPTKNLGGFGDGGAIVTDDEKLNDKLRILRNYGCNIKYHNAVKGFNSRLDELQAGLLSVKLSHIHELTAERQNIADCYNKRIVNPMVHKPKILFEATHVYHLYVVRVENREKFRAYLLNKGIMTDVHYPIPPHLSEAYSDLGYKRGDFTLAEKYADEVVSLPIFNGMTQEEVDFVVNEVNGYKG